uniref:Cyclin-dependent kinases regulatory subunit n=1 Tax=Chromera velia CCMP2878 TaxID=1169474 RepID=A0A0G4I846_9ALVE|mmetsp:Transcript_28379/g.55551  ORF Transcript_28379/g.55551 Transcript_28379/m.55551 type:complete len:99 (-) Transcript_28379:659-955(-)|eukprot:Cvel_11853.t1-p1 / transcript=Cvel_11853.t1 / gene=Cvel_11853 / organism=Chromera_velia_CCMP2878 / gene_product=Cyclin-dependent kinases regulatory subunit 1, putative / transcript_product=Cyclin-dependent kinases regulatory subunit 1, putative / location=Cvel_scaffold756:9277-11068(+) / protein_length=98 / sequence_SO=supercontig / SO=protein_coding / is_pseudo=false
MPHYPEQIEYSEKYNDDTHEYRHVILSKPVAKKLHALQASKSKSQQLLTEDEWRGLGVQQSRGWMHYEIHRPEPHILLFKRPLGTDPVTGLPPGAVPN